MSAHTPGPWARTNLTIHTQSTAHRGALGLARVFDWIETDGVLDANEATANARLIAAAPALLEALEHMIGASTIVHTQGETERIHALSQARAAIAQAKGERS